MSEIKFPKCGSVDGVVQRDRLDDKYYDCLICDTVFTEWQQTEIAALREENAALREQRSTIVEASLQNDAERDRMRKALEEIESALDYEINHHGGTMVLCGCLRLAKRGLGRE